jgi:hypothetical protein
VTVATTTSPGYDLVLLAHVLAAVVGLVALAVAAGSALALGGVLRRGAPVPDALARYYRPGVNWAGRVLFLVPVFGMALLVMSGGQWDFGDTWVSLGMAVWAGVAVVAEAYVWPEERRLQEVVAAVRDPAGQEPRATATATADVVAGSADDAPDLVGAARGCVRIGVVGSALGTVLVVIFVVMVAKP